MPRPKRRPSAADRTLAASNRQMILFFGSLILGVLLLIGLVFLAVDQLIVRLPPSAEQSLGKQIVAQFEEQAKTTPAQVKLNQLLDRLEQHLPPEHRKYHQYQVLLIPDEAVNALAVPGDRIILLSGLLKAVESENELMMVLGHELGHFAHRDHLRGLGRGIALQLILSALTGNSQVANSTAELAANLSQAQFSQGQEIAADQFGLDLLQKTYHQVAGATAFFDRLSREDPSNQAILSTHPSPKQRVRRLYQEIAKKGYAIGSTQPLPPELKQQAKP